MRCGASFTSKLEGMIKDKSLSQELQNAFKKYTEDKKKKLAFDFSPQVLTTGFWPAFKIDTLTIPIPELKQCFEVFKEFYDSRTQSRLLKWVHSLGTAQILARYKNGDKDLQMSSYQVSYMLQ